MDLVTVESVHPSILLSNVSRTRRNGCRRGARSRGIKIGLQAPRRAPLTAPPPPSGFNPRLLPQVPVHADALTIASLAHNVRQHSRPSEASASRPALVHLLRPFFAVAVAVAVALALSMAILGKVYHSITVAWLCHDRNTLAAARSMLDEQYGFLTPDSLASGMTYWVGRFDVHYIVLACPPPGARAAFPPPRMARKVVEAFPSICFCMLLSEVTGDPVKDGPVDQGDVLISDPFLISNSKGSRSSSVERISQDFYPVGTRPDGALACLSIVNRMARRDPNLRGKALDGFRQRVRTPHCLPKKPQKPLAKLNPRSQDQEQDLPSQIQVHFKSDSRRDGSVPRPTGRRRRNQSADISHDSIDIPKDIFRGPLRVPCVSVTAIREVEGVHSEGDWQAYAAAVSAAYAAKLLYHVGQIFDRTMSRLGPDQHGPPPPIKGVASTWKRLHEYDGTVLCAAAAADELDIVQSLLRNGTSVNARDVEGETALQVACRYGRERIVDHLLILGADVRLFDVYDRTALHEAARMGQEEFVEGLLASGADATAVDYQGRTPFSEAEQHGHYYIAELLRPRDSNARGKDLRLFEAVLLGQDILVDALLRSGADVRTAAGNGATLLHEAIRRGHSVTAIVLLRYGADPAAADVDGRTPLSEAIAQRNTVLVQRLVASGAKLEVPLDAPPDCASPTSPRSFYSTDYSSRRYTIAPTVVDLGEARHEEDMGGHSSASPSWLKSARMGFKALVIRHHVA